MTEQIFNQSINQKIRRSALYKKIQYFVLDKVLAGIALFEDIGFMVNGTPHGCIVYIYKLHELGINSVTITEIIVDIKNEHAKMVLLLYIRLLKDFKNHLDFIKTFLRVYTNLKVINESNDLVYEYFDVLVDGLLEKKYFYGIYLRDYKFDIYKN